MSLDSSLKIAGSVTGHRNVLTRAERVAMLAKTGEFDKDSDSPLGMRKVTNRKITAGKKKKKKDAEE